VAKEKEKEKEKEKGTKAVARRQPNVIRRYFNETIGELRKVSWPTRKEALNLTLVVLVVMVVMSLFLGALDFIYGQIFALILA